MTDEKYDIVKLKKGKYSLSRERDGVGDSGPMLHAIDVSKIKTLGDINDNSTGVVAKREIRVGCAVLCGTYFARTFGQDWWLTTPVTEILEVNEDKSKVKFKTGNSVYTVKVF